MRTIKGFVFSPSYEFAAPMFVPTGITLQTSLDGINWVNIGQYLGNDTLGSPSNPEKKNISFYTPVTSRYFKFILTRPVYGYAGISELNSYE